MNPIVPEEVNVFKVPHMRMKVLVDDYCNMVSIYIRIYLYNVLL